MSIENSARTRRSTALLWERHFKFPLNSALRLFKSFSEELLSRAGEKGADNEWEIGNEMKKLMTVISSNGLQGRHLIIRDLSSEIKLLGDFPIAKGVLSSIWLGRLENGTQVAVKLFNPSRAIGTHKEFVREAYVWFRASRHENILPLLGIARKRGSLALVSPWMPERDLGTYVTTHPNVNRLQLLADVACGLAYLHGQGIVYGNILPSTAVVSGMGRAYLSSFLIAHSQQDDDYAPTSALNWHIISPELLDPARGSFEMEQNLTTPETDVFIFGKMCMMIMTDNTPYKGHRGVVIRNVLEGRLPDRPRALESLGFTDDFWRLMTSCWNREPVQRPTMFDVARRMVQLAESFTQPVSDVAPPMYSRDVLRDISAEIKQLSEYPIASGGSCDLYLGERLGAEKVALKLVRFIGSEKDVARRRLMNEARLWAEFQHPRILEFYGICEYGTMSLYMVSPWLENGNICQYLFHVNPDADRYRLLRETAEGLLYLHSRQPPVVHGDLKGANILITSGSTAVLTDFGLSKFSHEATTTNLQGAGSPRWMAPELILAGDNVIGPLKTQKSDVYAFGHVIIEVLSDKKPFHNLKEDLHVIVELIRGGRSSRPDGPVANKWLDNKLWEISRKYTAIDPEDRPGIEMFRDLVQSRRISTARVQS